MKSLSPTDLFFYPYVKFEEDAKLVGRYQVPGRPTCLTVVGRRSVPAAAKSELETKAVESEQPTKVKKKKEKGKNERRTTSVSGISVPWQITCKH